MSSSTPGQMESVAIGRVRRVSPASLAEFITKPPEPPRCAPAQPEPGCFQTVDSLLLSNRLNLAQALTNAEATAGLLAK